MSLKEYEFYNKIKDWDFSKINYEEEILTDWDLYEILKSHINKESKILDLGTGGGEKVLKYFPECFEIIATDFSEEMIKTAKINLEKSDRKNIQFRVMDNLNMDVEDNYFDLVVARHTCIDAKGIYNALKPGGYLLVRGVDKEDSIKLKDYFGKGQAYFDSVSISKIDYDNIVKAGFKDVSLTLIDGVDYYKTKEDLLALLLKTPILDDFSEIDDNRFIEKELINLEILDKYIENNTCEKGIILKRKYYGIVARK